MTLLYLHCNEQQAAYFAAREHFELKNQALDSIGEAQFNLELEYQLVLLMALQPGARDPKARLFSDVAEVRASLTPNEVEEIIQAHMNEQATEIAAWTGRPKDAFLRQLARELAVDESTPPEELLAAVGRLRGAAGLVDALNEDANG